MTSKSVKLLATKSQRYENRAVEAGEILMATPAVAKTLIAIKRAEPFVENKSKKPKAAAAQPTQPQPEQQPSAAATQESAPHGTAASSTSVAPMTTGSMMGEATEYNRRDLKARP